MRALLVCTAAAALVAGCRDQAAENQAEGPMGNNATASANAAAPATNASAPLGAAVSGDEAKRIMNVRHEGMEEIGDAMKPLAAAMKSDAPNLDIVRTHAATIARLAPEVSGWFPPGTGPDVGKTDAKAEIWQKPEDFAAKTRDFQQAAQAFNTAAQGSDVAAIKGAFGNLGKSCKACHDPYRAKDD